MLVMYVLFQYYGFSYLLGNLEGLQKHRLTLISKMHSPQTRKTFFQRTVLFSICTKPENRNMFSLQNTSIFEMRGGRLFAYGFRC